MEEGYKALGPKVQQFKRSVDQGSGSTAPPSCWAARGGQIAIGHGESGSDRSGERRQKFHERVTGQRVRAMRLAQLVRHSDWRVRAKLAMG